MQQRVNHEASVPARRDSGRTATSERDQMPALGSIVGNRAIGRALLDARPSSPRQLQRLVTTSSSLRWHGGDPKEDRYVLGIKLQTMSDTYKSLLAALDTYHAGLRAPISGSDLSHAGVLIAALDGITAVATKYGKDHHDDAVEARAELSKIQSDGGNDEKPRQIVARHAAIANILRDASLDRANVTKTVRLFSTSQAAHLVSRPWRDAVRDPSPPATTPMQISPPQTQQPPTSTWSSASSSHLLTGNPKEMQGPAGDVTAHGNVTLQDEQASGFRTGPQINAPSDRLRMVAVSAPLGGVVETAVGAQPTDDRLFKLGGDEIPVWAPSQIGEALDPTTIFIADRPEGQDVKQTGLGDCYYLAVLSSVADRDPAAIKRIIRPTSSGVSVILHHRGTGPSQWVKTPLHLDRQLALGSDDSLRGAHVRYQAVRSRWTVSPDAVWGYEIHRVDVVEAALWAPLMEKAYARFAEAHGIYGGDATGGLPYAAALPGSSGYNVIDAGGLSRMVFGVLYGKGLDATVPQATSSVDVAPGQQNAEAIRKLQQLLKRGPQDPITHLVAGIGQGEQAARARTMASAECAKLYEPDTPEYAFLRRKVPDSADRQALRSGLEALVAAIDAYNHARAGTDQDAITTATEDVGTAAQDLANRATIWAAFFHDGDPGRPATVTALLEMLAAITPFGTHASTGRRFVYSRHAYAVVDVQLRRADGVRLGVNALPRFVDAGQSTVQLRNPHGANTPNPSGAAETGSRGVFTLTLEQFFQHFATLEYGVVARG